MESKKSNTSDKPKGVSQILDEQIEAGLHVFKRSKNALFISSFTAGLEIGFSMLTMGILYTLFNTRTDVDMLKLIVALGYPLGFIFVIIGRSELFTEQTALAILPVLNKSVAWMDLFILWGIVYAGNLTGGFLFGWLILELSTQIDSISVDAFEKLAVDLIQYNAWTIFLSALLAGWMMGLLGWLVTSSQETISRIFAVMLVTFTIGVAGLHHCIVGSVEVFTGMISSPNINLADYLRFLVWASVGNAIGGVVFVAILKYSHIRS